MAKCVVCWCDLPAELLAIIAGQTPTDIILFRSVCRSWRLSLPPPLPNNHILSPLFPLTISFHDRKPTTDHVTTNAVYLLRHGRDHSKVWMLSVQESDPGKLRMQHPLTYRTIPGSSGNILDLSEWGVTQIHTSYTYNGDQWRHQRKVVMVPNSTTAIALCGYPNSLWAFRTKEEGEEGNIVYASQLSPFVHRGEIDDFVSFNGWIYLADGNVVLYDILMFDYKTSKLFGIVCDNLRHYLISATPFRVRFVISDGDLYVVFMSTDNIIPDLDFHECRVYRLVRDDMNVPTCCKWERAEDLGDRLFCINNHCSFSVSARALPRPWKGNCVASFDQEEEIEVFDLGADEFQLQCSYLSRRLLSVKGYSDLFSAPCLCKQVTQQQSINKCSSVDK